MFTWAVTFFDAMRPWRKPQTPLKIKKTDAPPRAAPLKLFEKKRSIFQNALYCVIDFLEHLGHLRFGLLNQFATVKNRLCTWIKYVFQFTLWKHNCLRCLKNDSFLKILIFDRICQSINQLKTWILCFVIILLSNGFQFMFYVFWSAD